MKNYDYLESVVNEEIVYQIFKHGDSPTIMAVCREKTSALKIIEALNDEYGAVPEEVVINLFEEEGISPYFEAGGN